MPATTQSPVPSGIRFREIETVTETYLDDLGQPQTRIVPKLDANGREIEIAAIEVPHDIAAEGAEALESFVAAARADGQLPPLPTPTPEQASSAPAADVDTTPSGDEA